MVLQTLMRLILQSLWRTCFYNLTDLSHKLFQGEAGADGTEGNRGNAGPLVQSYSTHIATEIELKCHHNLIYTSYSQNYIFLSNNYIIAIVLQNIYNYSNRIQMSTKFNLHKFAVVQMTFSSIIIAKSI